MLPCWSETTPCGQETLPAVKPALGDNGTPAGVNNDTLLLVGPGGEAAQTCEEKPKLPSQRLPRASKVMPKPEPEIPPPLYGEPGNVWPVGVKRNRSLPG